MRGYALPGLIMIALFLPAVGGRAEELIMLKNQDINIEKVTSLKIGGHAYRFESGILTVPENRNRPDSRQLALPVKRIRTLDKNPGDPIFWLNGGPGAGNLTFKPIPALLVHHDLVMVGYRGVDGETALDCWEIRRALQGDGRDLFSPASRGLLKAALRQCAQRLQKSGKDLSGYTVPEVIADLETARQALGYGSIQLLSASYGTRVALLYSQLHPHNVSRSCLLGANPPGHFLWRPEVTDRQLVYYAKLYREAFPDKEDLAEMLRRVAGHMPAHWLGLRIDPGKVKVMSFLMLFHRGPAAVVFDAYRAAGRGDASGLFLMQLAYQVMMPRALNWADLFSKGGIDYDPSLDYSALLNPKETILGAPLSRLIWENVGDWPMAEIPVSLKTMQSSSTPTLIVSGTLDFSTPAEMATRELLPKLTDGHQVILSEIGHVEDMVSLQPHALARLLSRFFDEGVVDASEFKPLPMNFKVPLGFPVLAKIGVVLVGVIIVLLLVMLLWLLGIPQRLAHPLGH